MISPEQWLIDNVKGYGDLKDPEKEAIKYFALLWSLFEHKMLNNKGNAQAICDLTAALEANQKIDLAAFDAPMAYFSRRYHRNGATTPEFNDLNFRNPDKAGLVESILRGNQHSVGGVLSAYLIIVYRLRNNLFHGEKWKYMIRGQLDNFQNANALLMATLEL